MTLEEFTQSIRAYLNQARHVASDHQRIAVEMGNLRPLLEGFEQLSGRLVSDVILPRVGALAACFQNSAMARRERRDACGAVFGYCDRFPVTARLEFTIEHDDPVENLIVRYEVRIQPVFLKYEPHDKLVVSICDCDEGRITAWVEDKLQSFLKDYLRLDRGDEYQEDEFVTDPVCGMRLCRNTAEAQESYRGHPYFFCTTDCRERFVKEPARYVWFRT